MKIFKINSNSDFFDICKNIGVSSFGIKIMNDKSNIEFIYIKQISSPAANILKQDALSLGADLVVHKDTIFGKDEKSNALLMGTKAQLVSLAKKAKKQDFKLKELSKFLLNSFTIKPKIPKIMGVLNINSDSFNPKSRIDFSNAISKIEQMIDDGADYIDIGGVSSRPGSKYCGSDEEFRRIKDVVSEIYRQNLYKKVNFSLDSFDKNCLKYSLDRGFKMINDISADVKLAKLAYEYDCEYCIMHMQNNPHTMQNNPKYNDLIDEIYIFLEQKAQKALEYGAKKLFLDVGIGFGKTSTDNVILIKHLEHFLLLGYPLLIGASRKSLINSYCKSEVDDRLAGSLYFHLKAFENGASILRVHDVKEHVQLFRMHKAMQEINLW